MFRRITQGRAYSVTSTFMTPGSSCIEMNLSLVGQGTGAGYGSVTGIVRLYFADPQLV